MTRGRGSRGRGSPQGRPPGARPEPAPARAVAPLPFSHPAAWLAAGVAAACIVLTVAFVLDDPDLWQHLLVGKAIWTLHRVPTTQLWSWPAYGAPDVNYAWGFEALIWPWWRVGGVWGLFAWRALTTVAIFAVAWAAARRMGARGLAPLAALVLCALVYRQRAQIRPESLASLLLALELWILETRRHGGPDRTAWLVPITWIWANVHLTYYLGFLLIGLHLILPQRAPGIDPAGEAGSGHPPRPPRRRLMWIALAALALSLANPFGWHALWEPFRFVLQGRQEPLYRVISELGPLDWKLNLTNGLALLLVGWPLLMAWRARRGEFDAVELLTWACFTAQGVLVQKFVGNLAVVAAPYLARDLDAWVRTLQWPRWSASPWARGALAASSCVVLGLPEWTNGATALGVGMRWGSYPVGACDFIATRGVRGRGFNHFRLGGYLLWRFWPESDRLPFMDIHQAGTPALRRGYLQALLSKAGWQALDQRYRFDYVVLARPQAPGDRLPDVLDADSSWALVFVDDAAALYLRRSGPLASIAAREAYHRLGAGREKLTALSDACGSDSALRIEVASELRKQIAASKTVALSHSFMANLMMAEGRLAGARAELEQSLAIDPRAPQTHLRLGMIALGEERPEEALAQLLRQRRLDPSVRGLDLGLGLAYQQLGDLGRAAAAFRRALERDPTNAYTRELLDAAQRGAPR